MDIPQDGQQHVGKGRCFFALSTLGIFFRICDGDLLVWDAVNVRHGTERAPEEGDEYDYTYGNAFFTKESDVQYGQDYGTAIARRGGRKGEREILRKQGRDFRMEVTGMLFPSSTSKRSADNGGENSGKTRYNLRRRV